MNRTWRLTRAGWFVLGVVAGILLTLFLQWAQEDYTACTDRGFDITVCGWG